MIELVFVGLAAAAAAMVTSGRYRVLEPFHSHVGDRLLVLEQWHTIILSMVGLFVGFVAAATLDASVTESVVMIVGGAAAGKAPDQLWTCPFCQSTHYSVIGSMSLGWDMWHGIAAWGVAIVALTWIEQD